MAHNRTKRIVVAALAAAAVIGGGIAGAAPASARTIVTDCPARPNWSNGIELWLSTGANFCFYDDGTTYKEAFANINNVQDVTSSRNTADIYIVGQTYPLTIYPNQSRHLSDAPGVTVYGVLIHG